MHAVRILESHHFEVNGLDYYEPLSKEQTKAVSVRCVVMHGPLPEHTHTDAEQVYYIRSGRGIMRIDDEEQEVEKDMVIYIPPGAAHSMTPLEGDEVLSYVFFNHYF
jgi:mannose-6-phosphate isomerase-like protein (cupin superfamily)